MFIASHFTFLFIFSFFYLALLFIFGFNTRGFFYDSTRRGKRPKKTNLENAKNFKQLFFSLILLSTTRAQTLNSSPKAFFCFSVSLIAARGASHNIYFISQDHVWVFCFHLTVPSTSYWHANELNGVMLHLESPKDHQS